MSDHLEADVFKTEHSDTDVDDLDISACPQAPDRDIVQPREQDKPVSYDRALKAAVELAANLPELSVNYRDVGLANGRILAERITSARPNPRYDCAEVDGFAARVNDLTDAGPWHLNVVSLSPDKTSARAINSKPMSCVSISAGDPVPYAFDCVIPRTQASQMFDRVSVITAPARYANIRQRGGNYAARSVLLEPGKSMTPRDIALCASNGLTHVALRRKLKVALISTHSGSVAPNANPDPDTTLETNRAMLLSTLSKPWITSRDYGTIGSEVDTLQTTIDLTKTWSDAIIVTGNPHDEDSNSLRQVIKNLSGTLHVDYTLAVTGEQVIIAELDGMLIFGLPKTTAAAHMAMYLLGLDVLRERSGIVQRKPTLMQAKAKFSLSSFRGQTDFPLVEQTGWDAGGLPLLKLSDNHSCTNLRNLAKADGFAKINDDVIAVKPGDVIEWKPFSCDSL